MDSGDAQPEQWAAPVPIPPTYWLGEDTLTLGLPWIVPGAAATLSGLLRPDHTVLEFGSGGSTVFFAERCAEVVSIETSKTWADQTSKALDERQLRNARVHVVGSLEEIERLVGPDPRFDVVVVDNDPEVLRRSALLRRARSWSRELIVVDNYLIFSLQNVNPRYFKGWRLARFDDPFWEGAGTLIYARRPHPASSVWHPGFTRITIGYRLRWSRHWVRVTWWRIGRRLRRTLGSR